MKIIDGKEYASELLWSLARRAEALKFKPILTDIVVGSNSVSMSYVKIKQKRAEECGFEFHLVQLPEHSTEDEINDAIRLEQGNLHCVGLLVQLPLPEHLDVARVCSAIDPKIDVDLLNPESSLASLGGSLLPPTPAAIFDLMLVPFGGSLEVVTSKKIVLIGNGKLVGKPLSHLLLSKSLNFSLIEIDTPAVEREQLLREADIVITAVGESGSLRSDELKDDVVVIDAGASEDGGSIKGDFVISNASQMEQGHDNGWYTPVPGGVGPVTVAKLIENAIIIAENRNALLGK